MFRSRGQRHEYSRQPFRWLGSPPGCVLRGGPRDVIDREPWRDRNGRGRHPREGLDVPVEVGLVGVAALRRYQGGAVTRGEAVCRVIETDKPRGALGVRPTWDRNRDHSRLGLHPTSAGERASA
jgi:hypothetical protein